MSWDVELVIALRNNLGDLDPDTPKYSDDALAQALLVSGNYVLTKLNVTTDLLIDTDNLTLVPDPTIAPRNDDFNVLTILRATVMILRAEVRAYGTQHIIIKDVASSIDLKRDLKTLKALADDAQEEFDDALYFILLGESIGGLAVMNCDRSCYYPTHSRWYWWGSNE